jgi:hypothetical protein
MSNIKTKECSFDDLRPKLANLVERHRIEDDPVICCYEVSVVPKGWWAFFWGQPEPYDHAHVITKRKLISVRVSKLYRSLGSVTSIDLIDIVNVEPTFAEQYGHMVTAHGAGEGTVDCPMSLEAQAEFMRVLQRAIEDAKLPGQAPQEAESLPEAEIAGDVAKRLQRLSQLFEQEIISKEEYQQQRQTILDEL